MQQQPSSVTPTQANIIKLAQKFAIMPSTQVENYLKLCNWRDIYAIITNVEIQLNTRVVCCSTLKWLVHHRKFVDQPLQLFKSLCRFYLDDAGENGELTKGQRIVEMVIEVIPSCYLSQSEKNSLIEDLIKLLENDPRKCKKLMTLLKFILETCQIDDINNQVISGELLLFLQRSLESNLPNTVKLSVSKYILKALQHLLDLINNDDQIQSNVVQEFLQSSTLARRTIQKIISDGSNNIQIISTQRDVNKVKYIALQLYSSIWVYYLEESMFKLCLSSLLTKPQQLMDEGAEIMERIIVMLQRSINQQAYYHYIHSNTQHIFITLLSMLTPKQSYLRKITEDPEEFVDILYDFCMEQQRELLEVKIGSLISSLCMYIDGFMSFVGSMCIMMIKNFNGTISQIPGFEAYMKIIDGMWAANAEEKVAACIIVLCAISDQLEKRQDLSLPLRAQLKSMNSLFNIETCKLPPILICRFMFLYSFNAYPKCLDIFLPYKNIMPVYQCQLQSCYKILHKYHNKYPECKKYIDEIGPVIIMSEHLTSLLETTIMTGQLNEGIQYKILEKLVGWLDGGIKAKNYIVCNKMSSLIGVLLDRMEVKDYGQAEEAVFGYLEPFFRFVAKPDGRQSEQFVIEISIAFVKRFPSLERSKQRLMVLIEMGFKIVERNHGILNNCIDLFFQLTKYLSNDLVKSLIQIYLGCLESQDREQDQWECYYGLEACMLRICQLRTVAPTINVSTIINKIGSYHSLLLQTKAVMFILSVILANLNSPEHFQQYLNFSSFPNKITIYQNKPYLIYLLTIIPHLDQTPPQSLGFLKLILQLLKQQKTIGKQIKKYEQSLYEDHQPDGQLAINAYHLSQKLVHPLLLKNLDVYNQFRKCWIAFQNKEYVRSQLSEEENQALMEMCTQTTINSKVRKIYKVKASTMQEQSEIG